MFQPSYTPCCALISNLTFCISSKIHILDYPVAFVNVRLWFCRIVQKRTSQMVMSKESCLCPLLLAKSVADRRMVIYTSLHLPISLSGSNVRLAKVTDVKAPPSVFIFWTNNKPLIKRIHTVSWFHGLLSILYTAENVYMSTSIIVQLLYTRN